VEVEVVQEVLLEEVEEEQQVEAEEDYLVNLEAIYYHLD
jgi:hypothetical protein